MLPLSQLHRNRTGQSECEEGTRVHQIYCEESKRKKPPQGRLSNEWPSRNCVSKDTNFCRASAEWPEWVNCFLKERNCVEQNETREQSLAEFRVCQPADVYSR